MADDLKIRVHVDVKVALKQGDKAKVGALRLILAAIKQYEVDQRALPGSAEELAILDKLAKQRRESIKAYGQADRQDLIDQEQFELDLILNYLPEPLDETEIDAMVTAAISEIGAAGIKDMGKVIGLLKPKLQGRADMGAVSGKIKAHLTG